jgi:Domain of unknown function (DUF4331)
VSFGSDALITRGHDVQFFAGFRSDPFFFDLLGFLNGLRFTGSDLFIDKNVFGIALDVPNRLLGASPKIGIWTRTLVPMTLQPDHLTQAGQMGRVGPHTDYLTEFPYLGKPPRVGGLGRMQNMNRRRLFKLAGAGSVAVAGAALPFADRVANQESSLFGFRATLGLPEPPLPGYVTFIVEGTVDVAKGTGLVTSRVLAGHPGEPSEIMLGVLVAGLGLMGRSLGGVGSQETGDGYEVELRETSQSDAQLPRGRAQSLPGAPAPEVVSGALKSVDEEFADMRAKKAHPHAASPTN